jgi:hypothetical protein
MTNEQVALIAAAAFCAPVETSTAIDVQRIAEEFAGWLNRGGKR